LGAERRLVPDRPHQPAIEEQRGRGCCFSPRSTRIVLSGFKLLPKRQRRVVRSLCHFGTLRRLSLPLSPRQYEAMHASGPITYFARTNHRNATHPQLAHWDSGDDRGVAGHRQRKASPSFSLTPREMIVRHLLLSLSLPKHPLTSLLGLPYAPRAESRSYR
jgi:hypothetical protein